MVDSRQGFSLVELVMVTAVIGMMTAIVLPRVRVTPRTRVRLAAQQLAQDLEYGRTRALVTRSLTRLEFAPASPSYTGYRDFNRDGVLAQSIAETDSLSGFRTRTFETGVAYGRSGAVPDLPLIPGSGNITVPSSRVDFDSRGMTMPFGTRGVIYITHSDDPAAVAAVSITGAAGIRAWVFAEGAWQ